MLLRGHSRARFRRARRIAADCVGYANRHNRISVAAIVAGYAGAFFLLAQIQGNAALFVSLIPVSLISALLGMRLGSLISVLFIPFMAGLNVVFKDESWVFLLNDGRPFAMFGIVVMATVVGRVRDLERTVDSRLERSSLALSESERMSSDRASLIEFGIKVAAAHSVKEICSAAETIIRQHVPIDRFAVMWQGDNDSTFRVIHTAGVDIEGVRVGDVRHVTPNWPSQKSDYRFASGTDESSLPVDSEVWRKGGFKSILRVPMRVDDRPVGFLAIGSVDDNAFSEANLRFVESVGQMIGPTLMAIGLLDESGTQTRIRTAISEVARAVALAIDPDSLYDIAFAQLQALLPVQMGLIAESVGVSEKLEVRRVCGREVPGVKVGDQFDWDDDMRSLSNEVFFLNVSDVEVGQDLFPLGPIFKSGLKSAAIVTLIAQGEPVGWIVIGSNNESLRDDYTSQLLEGISIQLSNAILRARISAEQGRLLNRLSAQNHELMEARQRIEDSEKELIQRNVDLERANEAKNTFLSAVTHELKTPLAIMVGFAELLQMNVAGNLNDQQLDQLKMIERNGRHLDLMVSDLVDVSRIESGRFSVTLEPFEPEVVLRETLAGFEAIASDKSQRIVQDLGMGGIWVKADRGRLAQIITNLVSNACKYSPSEADVIVSADVEGNDLVVSVEDSGLGISKEDQAKLFTPFFRSTNDEAKKEKGTGLGLLITKSIVELHGGTLTLDSALGEGTTITVRMPGVMESAPGVADVGRGSNQGSAASTDDGAAA